ncbi:MAG: ABC-F family ATP-binding cassette domain-containing protein [Sphingomonadales bacterium]|nr:ABC-F family ATP-binding cassette domain-containing protein [Sphingomonadales bacterium]
MNLLSAEKLTKQYGDHPLFRDLSFGLQLGQKVALLGHNGCGKSTLLRILAGMEKADSGQFSLRRDLRLAYLEQEPLNRKTGSIRQWLEEAYPKSVSNTALQGNGLQNLDDAYDEARRIMDGLGITDPDLPLAGLSGGQKKRVALAGMLSSRPELMLLDEPTNHLDLEVVEWLEQYLRRQKCTVLLVTHDRYFMESVCQEIYEMSNGKLYRHPGTYSQYLRNKQARQAIEVVDAEKARNRMRSELEWIRRQPKARATKSKAREEAFYRLQKQAKGPKRRGDMQLDAQNQRLGGKILEMAYLRKQFGGRTLIHDFSYLFTRYDRIGVIGANGAGKSTLLNLIAGTLRPDGGKVERGDNTRIGYYTQHELEYDPNQTVIGLVRERAEYIKLSDGRELSASSYLNRFLFPPKQQHDLVSKLSGGEKRRLQLLLVLMEGPNLLLLDEPTNDLDLDTLQVIEEFLDEFEGCLMMVSHDRYFMDRLVDHLFVFDGEGNISDFPGNYTEYRNRKKSGKSRVEDSPTEPIGRRIDAPDHPRRLTYREQKELEQSERLMADLTAEMARLDAHLSGGSGGHDDFARWGQERALCVVRLEEAEMRWLKLDELRSGGAAG